MTYEPNTPREKLIALLLQERLHALSKGRLQRVSREGVLPLSYAQERLWFLQERDGGNAYNMHSGVVLEGSLSLPALEASLNGLIERHEPLRARFVLAAGAVAPHQEFDGAGKIAPSVYEARSEDVRGLVSAHAGQIFDLGHGPQLRVLVLRLGEQEHVVSLVMHHIITDGWSMEVLVRDLQALYAAELEHRASGLAPLEIQYADYAVWQRGQDLSRHLAYWTSSLGGYAGSFDLAEEAATRRKGPGRVGRVRRLLPLEVAETLGRFSSERQSSLFMVLLSGLAVLVYRRTRQPDLCIGTTVAGREQLELEPLIGFFINILPLRLKVSSELTGEQLLEQVRQVVLDGLSHQGLSYEQMLAALPELRQQDGGSLLPVMLRHQNFPEADIREWAGGLKARELSASAEPIGHAKCDLDLQYYGNAGGLSVVAEFDTARFSAERVEALLLELEFLLGCLIAAPHASLSELIEPSIEERAQLAVWNETSRHFADVSLTEMFAYQVGTRPEAIACRDGEQALSYAELDRRSDILARALLGQGVGAGGRVAVYLPRSAEFLTALLAVFKARGVYVPIDPSYPAAYVQRILSDARPAIVLAGSSVDAGNFVSGATVLPVDGTLFAQKYEPLEEGSAAKPEDLAYIAYTSGSTGEPKGVCVEHGQLLNCLQSLWAQMPFATDEVVAQKTSSIFVVSIKEMLSGLLVGVPQVIVPDLVVRDIPAFAAALQRFRVTRLYLVPSHLAALLDHAELLTSLRSVITAGEPLSQSLRRRFEQVLAGVRLYNNYGCTELNDITYCEPGDQESPGTLVPLGRPISNTRLYVLDEMHRVMPLGVVGELYVEGAAVGRGYWNQPALSAERFIASPFGASGKKLFRTGDMVRRLADGRLEYLGREDFQVKIRGQRIDLLQVEQTLGEHPEVARCAVMGHNSGTATAQLVAYYVAAGAAPNHNQLHAWLRERLPGYMVPSRFVRLAELPVLPNGKRDMRSLPALEEGSLLTGGHRRPLSETERTLAGIWAEALQVPVERIGLEDNFFALGGHSLLAVRVAEQLRQAGLHAEMSVLFGQPTLAALAEAVGGGRVIAVPANGIPMLCELIVPEMLHLVELTKDEIARIVAGVSGGAANVQDIYPLAPLQEGLLFHHLMGRQGDPYLLNSVFSVESREQLDALLSALQAVIDRHDILRTAVQWEGVREPVQVVWRKAALPVEEVDLDSGGGDPVEQLRQRFDARHYRLDVRRAPLLQVSVARDERSNRWLILLLFHHIVMDRTALEIVQHEVEVHLRGEASALPAPLPFRNYVAQARLGVSREEHEAFFRSMLGDVEEPTMPFGLCESPDASQEAVEALRRIDEGLSRRLRNRARGLGVSVASLFHLAWAQLLARTSGRDDVVFGTVLFGRMQGGSGADRVLGMFINTLPIRIRLGSQDVTESVRETHRLLSALLMHEHAPLTLAQRCSGVAAPAPLFRTLLNYRHATVLEGTGSGPEQRQSGIQFIDAEERTNYPLSLSIDDVQDGFRLHVEAVASVDADRICGYMERALEQIADALESSPHAPMHDLDLLSAEERRQMDGWNETAVSMPESLLPELFEAQVIKTPEATAVVYEEQSLSYAELNCRANRLAHLLRERGVGPETIVGICVERSLEMVISLLGVLKAGGAYLPLDPLYPQERLAFMLEDARPLCVITTGVAADILPASTPLLRLDGEEMPSLLAAQPEINPARHELNPEHPAYVIYTSGSTGQPKGVVVTGAALRNFLAAIGEQVHLTADDQMLAVTTIAFDIAALEIYLPLIGGATLLLASKLAIHDPSRLLQLLRDQKVKVVQATPTQWRMLVDSEPSLLEGLTMLVGGEALPADLASRLYSVGGSLTNLYGPTETTIWSVAQRLDEEMSAAPPIGRPIWNTQIYVLDGYLRPVPVGVAGELYIAGSGLARGYLNRAELTAERFIASPHGEPGSRMYRTGDVARYRADGNLEYLGRADDQVKIRGFRIELGEIESVLDSHPALAQSVVIAREDEPGDKRLVAYVIAAVGTEIDASELRSYLGRSLPAYMVPSAFVALERFPLTSNGKLNRKLLPAPEWRSKEYEAPVGETETQIAAVFAEVLKVKGVGRHDNFFELGGYSLLATQLVSQLRQEGLDVEVHALFTAPTVAKLAASIEEVEIVL
jgi:amino acid adenylation domain-containing protein